MARKSIISRTKVGLLLGLLVVFLSGLLFYRQRRRQSASVAPPREPLADISGPPPGVRGLSEQEAATRQPDFDLQAETRAEQRRFFRHAVRQSLLSIFNIDLFGIAIVLFWLGSPEGALGTLLLVLLNVVINVFQEMYTKRKLDLILQSLRPQATIIRDARLHSIDPALVVQGDNLVIGKGDEILVDGELIGRGEITIEQATVGQDARQVQVGAGDAVRAGDYCIAGRGVYRAAESGFERYKTAPGSDLQLLLGERTPLQRFMELFFRLLFGLVLIFGVLLVLDAVAFQNNLVSREYRDAFSIVFGIAPTSLFFILIITYAIGTLRISERGALVYNSQSIEALANVKTLCISKESLVGGLQVTLESIELPAEHEPLSENLIRRVLGDILNSVPLATNMGRMLAEALPGEAHTPIEIATFIYRHGWYGCTFDDPDLRGTFVLGVPEVLEDSLVKDIDVMLEQSLTQVQRGLGRWLKRFTRRGGDGNGKRLETQQASPALDVGESPSGGLAAQSESAKPGWRERFKERLERLLNPIEDLERMVAKPQAPDEKITLLFAYLQDPNSLFDQEGEPQIPQGLIPLTRLGISEVVRPEAEQTLNELLAAGLQVKILAVDTPGRAAATARDLGLLGEQPVIISGVALDGLTAQDFSRLVEEVDVIGDLTPASKAAVVQSLRGPNSTVAMVGSHINDVPAMRQADLRVALKSGAQAALRLTDIVLLEDSLEALPHVLTTGQRLVNGVLDTFKLYLSQVMMQLLLILSILFLNLEKFPYHPTQAGVLTAFTIAVPNAFLSLWAADGRVTGATMRRRLARFIIPTALTFAVLAWVVYVLFLTQTGNVEYAELAVTWTLLMAGWLRIFFVQPPTPFWVGGAPLRGDRRVIGLVFVAALLFLLIVSFPLFQDLLRIGWLDSLADYLLVMLLVGIWALLLRTIWRSRILEPVINWISPADRD